MENCLFRVPAADCVSMCNEKFLEKFCPLCYKQVIALSPRRIKDKFSLVFSKFSQIALVATRLGQFCENFENTRENLSLILLGLMQLHILIFLLALLLISQCRLSHFSQQILYTHVERAGNQDLLQQMGHLLELKL